MPKTKQQKQLDAIERKRKNFHKHQKAWIDAQADLMSATNAGLEHTINYLTTRANDAEKRLLIAAKEANLDRYGNPLSVTVNTNIHDEFVFGRSYDPLRNLDRTKS